jgi:hypothetical protein
MNAVMFFLSKKEPLHFAEALLNYVLMVGY